MKFAVIVASLPAVCAATWKPIARDAPPSPLPPPSPIPHATGYLSVVNGSGYALGTVSSAFSAFGEAGLGSGAGAPLILSAAPPPGAAKFEIAVTGASYPYLGAAVGFASSGADLGPGSANYAVLTAVASAPQGGPVGAGSAFSEATGTPAPVESAMWAWDAGAGALVPAWTNSDGSTAAAALVYDAADDVLLLVGDVVAFKAAIRVEVTPVSLQPVAAQS